MIELKPKTYLKDISDIAQYYRQTRQTQRINLIISVLYNIIILFFIIGSIVSVIRSGTISSMFGEQKDLSRRFNCTSQDTNVNDIVNTYAEANYFKTMYGGNCNLYHQLNGGEE